MSPGEEESPAVPVLSRLEQQEKARSILLRILAAAPKSRSQLEASLARKEIDEDVATELLDRFEEVGLVDDEDYAARIVRARFAERHQARRAIAHELNRKGIAPDTAERALSQLDADDEAVAALDLARARLRRTASLERTVRIRRAMGALARKGYAPGVAMSSIHQALAEESAASTETELAYDDVSWIDDDL
ncbi:regulatory protein RecX [Sanguibacter antarcticus]|uniref:Regulatory protein RecX n=1 Tax=Sanguibacter antarcticus TaxID=372484 RepID=A0A2A9E3U5_9MICO|nr:regulatory protein RecX [Sanguibacter antarcticus]PFG33503.1 regulatory protein [Sanguibacter antarcticus]